MNTLDQLSLADRRADKADLERSWGFIAQAIGSLPYPEPTDVKLILESAKYLVQAHIDNAKSDIERIKKRALESHHDHS